MENPWNWRDSERQPAIKQDNERHAATLWYQKGQQASIGDSARHVATPSDWRDSERQPARIGESRRHVATPCYWKDCQRQPAKKKKP